MLEESKTECHKVLKISVIGDPLQLKPFWKYTMIESKKFFEPYYQVLNAMQCKSWTNFPMEKYIIKSDSGPHLPSYISVDTEYKIGNKSVKLFGKQPWPNDLLNLDVSQLDALQSALTHEFVLVHGPPGTGKTYLIEAIINILIDNKSVLSTPILLISSKNDYVDCILEALVLKKRNVIRLGGQTKNDTVKKILLSNVVKRGGEKYMKARSERVKETVQRKIKQSGTDVKEEVDILNKGRTSYIEWYEREAAAQLLSAKVEVVGGTTAGCAKLHCLLGRLQPEVVIVENANEVLESHAIAALSDGCKHLILVGDKNQLKPQVGSMCSIGKYNLDVSLFERMSRCGMKCCTLTGQHRMRPEIGSLISPTIYPIMNNHPEVLNLPKIKGIKNNLYFIDHEVAEIKINEDFSFTNKHEADMVLALADYLLKQGYSAKDLTILVPYVAQQNFMRASAKDYPSLRNVEILTIDSYSGHENTIILLSLVLSHTKNISFLSSVNRVSFALSRAKCGLYIIGNMKTLTRSRGLWSSLNAVLRRQQAIGNGIYLECQTHKTVSLMTRKQDFDQWKNGGCGLPCSLPLECGHLCQLKCHPLLKEHETYICREPCSRYCEENIYKCKKRCHEECGPFPAATVTLQCGHTAVKRGGAGRSQVCMEPTVVTLLCCLRTVVPCSEADSWYYSRIM